MAYSQDFKNECINLIEAGVPVGEVAKEQNVTRATLNNWRKRKAKTTGTTSIKQIKKQIATLSKRNPTAAVSRNLAMLSSTLARLEGLEKKKREAKKKIKPQVEITTSKEAKELKEKILETGGLYEYQREFLECNDQFRLVLKSRQIGFSYVSSADACLGAMAGRNQLFLSASEEQALILMRYLRDWAKRYGVVFKRDSEHEIELENGAIIKALANNFRTVQGFTGDIWMDEFAWYQNPKKIWHAFVPSIGAIKGRLTILSTPFEEHSLFHELYSDELKYYMFARFRVDIYRAIKDGLEFDLETMKALFDTDTWASAYECMFVDDESSLMSINLIKSCVDESLHYSAPASNTSLYCGYDVGRVKDRSTLSGLELKKNIYHLAMMDVLAGAKFEEQKNHLRGFMRTYPLALLRMDKTGLGLNLTENLHDMFTSRVSGVWFTNTKKEEMALNLKKLFEDKRIRIPNDPALIADIHAIKRTIGAKSFKYDAKRNEYGHADRFWALALGASHIEAVRKKGGGGAYIF